MRNSFYQSETEQRNSLMKKIQKSAELLWVFGIVFVALGVAICSKANLGVSMIAAPTLDSPSSRIPCGVNDPKKKATHRCAVSLRCESPFRLVYFWYLYPRIWSINTSLDVLFDRMKYCLRDSPSPISVRNVPLLLRIRYSTSNSYCV